MKHLSQVLEAAKREDCRTSADIADVTGIPIGSVSAHISELIKCGLLRRTGRKFYRFDGCGSPPYLEFEPVEHLTSH